MEICCVRDSHAVLNVSHLDLFDNLIRKRTALLEKKLKMLTTKEQDGRVTVSWSVLQAVLKQSAGMSCLDHTVSLVTNLSITHFQMPTCFGSNILDPRNANGFGRVR